MTSLLPGFEYDVFISYRQKDNKHDGWVTEFVDNLRGELESTFKEEISVYFDINLHDGLLETHDVDASLKDKLKCLVFIPIISRTYCDPRSFAWEHEFKAFLEQTSKDQFGLKVKLPNGNVATRILPIQIHDLHPEDKSLLEKELGGALRAIEFIYKEPGVNKPLTSDDDEKKNLNGTKYRIQINKVSNAIDEIIHSLKVKKPTSIDRRVSSDQPYYDKEESIGKKLSEATVIKKKSNYWLALLFLVVLCVTGAFAAFKIIKGSKKANDITTLEKSIAVLPFKLLSDEPDKQYLADGMMDAITLHLSRIKDLRVISRTSVEQYRGSTKTTSQIGKELDVEYLLEGSFQKYGDNVRLIVQLIKTGKEGHKWANNYDRKWNDIFSVQSNVAQAIAKELEAVVTPEEKQIIDIIPTKNLTAYDYLLKGNVELGTFWSHFPDANFNISLKNAENLYKKALDYDSTFSAAYVGLANVYYAERSGESYFSKNYLDSILILTDLALSYDNHSAEAYSMRGHYYINNGNSKQAIEEYNKALKYNPNNAVVYRDLSWLVYFNDNDYSDYIKALEYLHKALSLTRGSDRPSYLKSIAGAYVSAGFPEKARYYYTETLKLDSDTIGYLSGLASVECFSGNTDSGFKLLQQAYSKDSNSFNLNRSVAYMYFLNGQYKKSLQYLSKIIKRYEYLSPYDYYGGVGWIGCVYWMNEDRKEAEYWFEKQEKFSDVSIRYGRGYGIGSFAYLDLASLYAFRADKGKAFENLRIFNKIKVCSIYNLFEIKINPLFNSLRNDTEFQKIIIELESKYQAEHERVRKWLEEKGEL